MKEKKPTEMARSLTATPETGIPPYGTAPVKPSLAWTDIKLDDVKKFMKIEKVGAAVLPAGRASDPAGVVEGRELAAQLRAALREIPEERRTAILLFDVDGYTYAEIAEITESSLGTVKSRISRGREELRGLLADLRPGTRGGELS